VVAGRTLVVGVYLVIMGGLALAGRAGRLSDSVFIAISLVLTYLMVFTPALDAQMGNAEITATRLTVYTMTGRRTLDLTALRRVRRFVFLMRSPVRDIDMLYVTDARGVRVGLRTPDAVRAVARAVRPSTRVSRRARRRLAGSRATARWGIVSLLTDLLLPVLLIATIVVLVPAIAATFVYGW
jgi:hypothetical protein